MLLSCCAEYSRRGTNALSVLIQDKQGRKPEQFELNQRQSSYEKYSITWEFSFFSLLHFHTLTEVTVVEPTLAARRFGSCAVTGLSWEESCQSTHRGRQCSHSTACSPGQPRKMRYSQPWLLKAQFGPQ